VRQSKPLRHLNKGVFIVLFPCSAICLPRVLAKAEPHDIFVIHLPWNVLVRDCAPCQNGLSMEA